LRQGFAGFIVQITSRWGHPSIFFLLTVLSTLYVGGFLGIGYWSPELLDSSASLLERIALHVRYGAPFSFTVIAIIFSHEMGHYFAARRYGVDSTLPFFIPFPFVPFTLIGTLGAFILIKSRFPHRKALFDIGVAGPFAGFLVAIPALIVGIQTSRPGPLLPAEGSISFGEPLLFQWLASWIWPGLPEGYVLYTSPIGIAAWFGLLLTALNLLPVGQLDGGHASYALLRRHGHLDSRPGRSSPSCPWPTSGLRGSSGLSFSTFSAFAGLIRRLLPTTSPLHAAGISWDWPPSPFSSSASLPSRLSSPGSRSGPH
jgi:membrane-associated protease RseP (regulator of RpoE activity)